MNNTALREAFSWIKSILFALIMVLICREFIFAPVKVDGKSMMPTFENNNRVMISKISKVERFDLIVFRSPYSEDTQYIKRVIGLPGDTVEIENDILYINSKEVNENYLNTNKEDVPSGALLTENLKVVVPNGYLYVLGDNRRNSSDSREFGVIKESSVIGEVKLRFYPIDEITIPK
ncbi:signal peptidase I [Robertmurraya massiliosenegalensis]|uniref:signal peptidase I n=1 Tax=Robertmurraya massiliosenegalensis TaxID=1287657 RepID=UPI0002E8B0DF|nr:signal peptidase I [Robertmurraya massiliosenegalensis]